MPWRRAWQLSLVFLPGEAPWTEESGWSQSVGSLRVGHDWVTKHSTVCNSDISVIHCTFQCTKPFQCTRIFINEYYFSLTLVTNKAKQPPLNPMDYIVHRILQARILEWVAYPFSRGSSWPRNWTRVSCTAGRFFTSWATREVWYTVLYMLPNLPLKNYTNSHAHVSIYLPSLLTLFKVTTI